MFSYLHYYIICQIVLWTRVCMSQVCDGVTGVTRVWRARHMQWNCASPLWPRTPHDVTMTMCTASRHHQQHHLWRTYHDVTNDTTISPYVPWRHHMTSHYVIQHHTTPRRHSMTHPMSWRMPNTTMTSLPHLWYHLLRNDSPSSLPLHDDSSLVINLPLRAAHAVIPLALCPRSSIHDIIPYASDLAPHYDIPFRHLHIMPYFPF